MTGKMHVHLTADPLGVKIAFERIFGCEARTFLSGSSLKAAAKGEEQASEEA